MATTFHGDGSAAIRMEGALAAHCACVYEQDTHKRLTTCASHRALVEDQRFSDGLLWALHTLGSREVEEWKES